MNRLNFTDNRSENDSSGNMGYTVDEAIEKAGGFGKYQWIYCSLTALCFVPNGLFIYNLGYFTMIPVMMCPDAAGGHFL